MFNAVQCKLVGHKIDRQRVWHDELDHRSTCQRCGAAMIKRNRTWRTFESEDVDERRKPHPHFDEAGA